MTARRIDRVRIATAGGLVEIAWSDREELLERLDGIAGSEDLIDAFRAVGHVRARRAQPETASAATRSARILGG